MADSTSRPVRCRMFHGFTLVELLVVVGIIALLVAMLFPVFSKAREQANRTKCAANLRVIGQAMTMYTERFGYYPGCVLQTTNAECALWPVALRAMLGGERRVFNCPSQDERCEWDDDRPLPLRRADGIEVANGYEEGECVVGAIPSWFSYSYNFFGATNSGTVLDGTQYGLGAYVRVGGLPGARAGRLRANRVRFPSMMIAVADSDADGWFDIGMCSLPSGRPPGRIHNRGCNVLFCDGHVQWYPQRDIVADPSLSAGSPRNAAVRRLWNNDHEPHFEL